MEKTHNKIKYSTIEKFCPSLSISDSDDTNPFARSRERKMKCEMVSLMKRFMGDFIKLWSRGILNMKPIQKKGHMTSHRNKYAMVGRLNIDDFRTNSGTSESHISFKIC